MANGEYLSAELAVASRIGEQCREGLCQGGWILPGDGQWVKKYGLQVPSALSPPWLSDRDRYCLPRFFDRGRQ